MVHGVHEILIDCSLYKTVAITLLSAILGMKLTRKIYPLIFSNFSIKHLSEMTSPALWLIFCGVVVLSETSEVSSCCV